MKDGNWIALHKELVHFLPHGRPYTLLEAMFSYTFDIDNGKEGTISGYSKLWGWSRTKVRKLITGLKTSSKQIKNRDKTGREQVILLKLNNLQDQKNTFKTGKKQIKNRGVDTTINPNPNPNPKEIKPLWSIPENINIKAWGEYEEHRKNKKGDFTDLAKTKACNLLLKYSNEEQQEIIDKAILSNWTGLFDLDKKKTTGFKTRSQRNAEAKAEVLREFHQSQEKDITP